MKKPTVRKAAPKVKAKTRAKPKPALGVGGMSASREQSVTIRKIDNGYITRKSGMVGKGPNARYVEQETFSKTEPKVTIPK